MNDMQAVFAIIGTNFAVVLVVVGFFSRSLRNEMNARLEPMQKDLDLISGALIPAGIKALASETSRRRHR